MRSGARGLAGRAVAASTCISGTDPLTRLPPPRAAERALEQLNYTKINDKPIRLMWSHRDPNTRKNNAANIFIKVRRAPRAPLRAPHCLA